MSQEQFKKKIPLRKVTVRHNEDVIHFTKVNIMNAMSEKLNNRELCSVRAMTAFVAHNQNVREEIVHTFVETEFAVSDISQLQRDDFERVIAYLVDLQCDLLTN